MCILSKHKQLSSTCIRNSDCNKRLNKMSAIILLILGNSCGRPLDLRYAASAISYNSHTIYCTLNTCNDTILYAFEIYFLWTCIYYKCTLLHSKIQMKNLSHKLTWFFVISYEEVTTKLFSLFTFCLSHTSSGKFLSVIIVL